MTITIIEDKIKRTRVSKVNNRNEGSLELKNAQTSKLFRFDGAITQSLIDSILILPNQIQKNRLRILTKHA